MIIKGSKAHEASESEQKEIMLNSLRNESLSIICLASMYAKKFEETGIDITERIATVEQQSAVIQNVYDQGYKKGFEEGIARGKKMEREEAAEIQKQSHYWNSEFMGNEQRSKAVADAVKNIAHRNPTKKKKRRK